MGKTPVGRVLLIAGRNLNYVVAASPIKANAKNGSPATESQPPGKRNRDARNSATFVYICAEGSKRNRGKQVGGKFGFAQSFPLVTILT